MGGESVASSEADTPRFGARNTSRLATLYKIMPDHVTREPEIYICTLALARPEFHQSRDEGGYHQIRA